MAESTPIEQRDPGEPIARDAVDPDLIKLKRARPKIGAITAAGLVFLSIVFLVRLNGDRKFAATGAPEKVAVSEVLAGNVGSDKYISVDAEPLMSHAIRATASKGSLGMRVTPMRGTGDRLWLVTSGDGWEQPATGAYVGRLRKLGDLPFAGAVEDYAANHPRPVFAAAAATRAGFSTNKVTTVAGDPVSIADGDTVAFDVIDPNAAVVIATFTGATKEHDALLDPASWTTQLAKAGITTIGTSTTDAGLGQVRFEVAMPVAAITSKLEAANLWAARVEPVMHHYTTTWNTLRTSTASGFNVGNATIPDANLDLVGLYVSRAIPSGAYALITGERPADYWYVLPITIALAAIGLIFAWALVRAIRRDLMPPPRAA